MMVRPNSATVAMMPACVSLVTGCAHASPQPTMPSSVEILTKTFSLYWRLANQPSRACTIEPFFLPDPNSAWYSSVGSYLNRYRFDFGDLHALLRPLSLVTRRPVRQTMLADAVRQSQRVGVQHLLQVLARLARVQHFLDAEYRAEVVSRTMARHFREQHC